MEQHNQIPSFDLSSGENTPELRVVDSSLGDLYLLSFSHIGSSHIKDNKPNQDYFNFQKDSDTLFAAVGDGLGSYQFSDEGSKFATKLITEKMKEFVTNSLTRIIEETYGNQSQRFNQIISKIFGSKPKSIKDSLSTFNEDKFKEIFINFINEIRNELDEQAKEKGLINEERTKQNTNENLEFPNEETKSAEIEYIYNKGDFATTCLFTMTDGNKVFCAQVGDGGIFLVRQNESSLILKPAKGNSISETIPITYDGWEKHLELSIFDVPSDALFLCLMTDGFADPINAPSDFFQRVVKEAQEKSKDEFKLWLEELNNHFESNGYSDDDKTVSFIFFRNIFKEQSE